MLINHLAQPKTSQTASKSPGNSAEHSTRTRTSRSGNDTDLHADATTDQGTRRAGCGGTTDSTGNGADRATDTLAVMGIHHPL